MTKTTILEKAKEILGETVLDVIFHDEKNNIVIISKMAEDVGNCPEELTSYVIYDIKIPIKEGTMFVQEDFCILTNPSYLPTFEEAILKYLSRKNFKFSVQIPLSEEDISDLLSGEEFDDWEFESDQGVQVKVELFNENYREEN